MNNKAMNDSISKLKDDIFPDEFWAMPNEQADRLEVTLRAGQLIKMLHLIESNQYYIDELKDEIKKLTTPWWSR